MTQPSPTLAAIPTLTFDEAIAAGEAEAERFLAALERVRHDQWTLPTDCDLWTVRDLVGHVIGSLDVFSSMRKSMRSFVVTTVRAKRRGSAQVDEMTKAQVEAYAHLRTDELAATFKRLVPANVAGRRRTPRPLRKIAMDFEGHPMSLGELMGHVLTRDLWMHRVDLCRATGQPFEATPDHDGRIVSDVVASWARRHGQRFSLSLTGPAGGAWADGEPDATSIEMDAIEFCRTLAGRAEGKGLLATPVVF